VAVDVPARPISFDALQGWAEDDHAAALAVFLKTCADIDGARWQSLCTPGEQARVADAARAFFETAFQPVLVSAPGAALFTGYFEPELDGSLTPTPEFAVPIYSRPPDLPKGRPWASRAEIERDGLLAGRGLEIAWLSDPVDKFFLQVQGSGRIRLTDGRMIRVGYGGKNGHEYRSIGRELVRRGVLQEDRVSARAIREWARRNPEAGRDLLQHNPSYVFFREVTTVAPEQGPLGTMNRPLTPLRSLAVDPAHIPLGAPVWVEKAGHSPLARLMVAQDTGSAIKGPQRGDIFYGSGEAAGEAAGTVKDTGRMVALLPIDRVQARAARAVPGG
jgi:membrane-bound lytic murein transglycosylase A